MLKRNQETNNSKPRASCHAKTRTGYPCTAKVVKGKNRCRMHGGLSTGAKTAEGIDRIRKAQNRRWAAYKAKRAKQLKSIFTPYQFRTRTQAHASWGVRNYLVE